MEKKERIVWLDLLRVIAMMSIIFYHVAGNTLGTYNITGTSKTVYEIIMLLLSFAIPIFMMISGYIFLNPNKKITVKEMLSKYCFRILLAILIFGSMFVLIEQVYLNNFDILELIKRVVFNDTWAHMWYLYLILGIYLITPIFKLITDNIDDKRFNYLIILLFIFTICIPELNRLLKWNIDLSIGITSTYIFYYFYGYYLGTKKLTNTYKCVSYVLGILSIILVIVSYLFKLDIVVLSYVSFTSFFIANLVFILLKDIKIKNKNISNLITSVAVCSYGIYIFHQLFINIIYKVFKIDFIIRYPYIGIIIYSFVIFLLSYLLIFLFRKIKYLRTIL